MLRRGADTAPAIAAGVCGGGAAYTGAVDAEAMVGEAASSTMAATRPAARRCCRPGRGSRAVRLPRSWAGDLHRDSDEAGPGGPACDGQGAEEQPPVVGDAQDDRPEAVRLLDVADERADQTEAVYRVPGTAATSAALSAVILEPIRTDVTKWHASIRSRIAFGRTVASVDVGGS